MQGMFHLYYHYHIFPFINTSKEHFSRDETIASLQPNGLCSKKTDGHVHKKPIIVKVLVHIYKMPSQNDGFMLS